MTTATVTPSHDHEPRGKQNVLLPRDNEPYQADSLTSARTALLMLLAALGGGVATLAAWKVLKATTLPAFNTSMVTRALGTAGLVLIFVLVGGLLLWWLLDEYRVRKGASGEKARPAWRRILTPVIAYVSPAMLTVASLGIPLSATRLWLDGIQVDQVFRTQFLTRMADTAAYQDMNYADMPSYYPMGWFWLGGRLANLLGIPGWEVYQPWALVSLAAAGCMLVPLWQHLTGSLPVATAIALATTAITLTTAAEEPYSALIGMGVPAATVLCARAFRGSWWSTFGIMVFLGISACFYTLFTGAVALTIVVLIGLLSALFARTWLPIVRVAIIGVGSLAIAAIAWGPYVLAALRSDAPLETTAQHYLPEEGTQIPVPFLSASVIGLLCLIGLIYLVFRVADREIHTMAWGLAGLYLWALASMVITLAGTTLLGFRIEILVVLQLATAGILALAEIRLRGVARLYPQGLPESTSKRITAAFAVVCMFGGLYYAQQIPEANESAIDHAYSDTDGYGERADRFTSDSSQNYSTIHQFLQEQGHVTNETVIMTDENLFMAYYPYFGYNAFTSHYANPLGEFSVRNEQMERWANLSQEATPEEFVEALDSDPWHSPDVILFRGSIDDPGEGYKIHLAEDIYPNQPNVRFRSIFFNPEVFEDEALWTMKQVGPFVVASRDNV